MRLRTFLHTSPFIRLLNNIKDSSRALGNFAVVIGAKGVCRSGQYRIPVLHDQVLVMFGTEQLWACIVFDLTKLGPPCSSFPCGQANSYSLKNSGFRSLLSLRAYRVTGEPFMGCGFGSPTQNNIEAVLSLQKRSKLFPALVSALTKVRGKL